MKTTKNREFKYGIVYFFHSNVYLGFNYFIAVYKKKFAFIFCASGFYSYKQRFESYVYNFDFHNRLKKKRYSYLPYEKPTVEYACKNEYTLWSDKVIYYNFSDLSKIPSCVNRLRNFSPIEYCICRYLHFHVFTVVNIVLYFGDFNF